MRAQDPFRHIAEILLKKSGDGGDVTMGAGAKARSVSLDGPSGTTKHAGFAGVEVVSSVKATSDHKAIAGDEELHREYQTKDVPLPEELEAKRQELIALWPTQQEYPPIHNCICEQLKAARWDCNMKRK